MPRSAPKFVPERFSLVAESLDPLATTYIESLAGKTPATVAAYRRSLRHFLAWLQAKLGCKATFDPTTFTRTAAQVSFADREKQGLSVSDRRGVTPLMYQHVSPYGVSDLDLTTRLPLREPVLAA
ncbi:MAG: hypothetical protein WCK70_13165 [Chloroflexales bacterium]